MPSFGPWVSEAAWIPIDASEANKFPKSRDYYFGTLGTTCVTLAHGRDVVLAPPQQGPRINMLHGPVAEVDGKPFPGVRWLALYKDPLLVQPHRLIPLGP